MNINIDDPTFCADYILVYYIDIDIDRYLHTFLYNIREHVTPDILTHTTHN
jgi:hypothetical protein